MEPIETRDAEPAWLRGRPRAGHTSVVNGVRADDGSFGTQPRRGDACERCRNNVDRRKCHETPFTILHPNLFPFIVIL